MAGLSCSGHCARGVLIIYNTILWLAGGFVLGFGIYLLVENNVGGSIDFLVEINEFIDMSRASDFLIKIAANAMIAVGAFIFLIGFCGCCGAIKESKCLLGSYMFCLGLLMLCEMAVSCTAIYFYTDTGRTESGWNEFLSSSQLEYSTWVTENYASNDNFREAINHFQISLECCGWNGLQDYNNVTWDNITGMVPSCCTLSDSKDLQSVRDMHYGDGAIINSTGCIQGDTRYIYSSDCGTELDEWLGANSVVFIGCGLGIACLEIVGLFFACCLCGALP